MALHIPEIAPGDATLTAAFRYAASGFYVLPVRAGTKHPGSIVGGNWQHQSSRDPEMLAAWFSGTNHGIALHAGRSGSVILDVDHPHKLPPVLTTAIAKCCPPHQSTRTNEPGKGHYVFTTPPGRTLGNGTGRLGGGWGEIRGLNGVIIAAPSIHEKTADGGRYQWLNTGPVPVLPEAVAELLHDSANAEDAATDAEVQAFLRDHTGCTRPALLAGWCSTFRTKIAEGESRHQRMVSVAAGAMREARAGYYPARLAAQQLGRAFIDAVRQPAVVGGQQGNPRGPGVAASEWAGILAWAVAQANAANLDEVHERLAEAMPNGDDLSWIPEQRTPNVDLATGEILDTPPPNADAPLVVTPDAFFDKHEGLLAANLADYILTIGPLAEGADDRIWAYEHGVWQASKTVIRDRTTRLLGNKFRLAHATNAEQIVRSKAPKITCEPISDVINFRNGLLDWRTGELHPHSAKIMTTVQLSAAWDETAACPEFDKFLAQVVPEDVIPLVWEAIGYLIYSGNPFHKAIMLTGEGRNGKGTLIRVINALLGKANTTATTLQALATERFAAANLFGKIANIAGDIDGTYLESTARFKAITGEDQITAEYKHRDAFDFTPWAVPVFSANKIPGSADATTGYLERWVVIPFPHDFTGREDRGLTARLITPAELAGIAQKAVPALRTLMEWRNFQTPPSAQAAKEEFVRRVDQVRTWIGDCAEISPKGIPDSAKHPWINRTVLYNAYKAWAERDGYRALKASEFYDRLKAAGAEPATIQGSRGFKGIKVSDPAVTQPW